MTTASMYQVQNYADAYAWAHAQSVEVYVDDPAYELGEEGRTLGLDFLLFPTVFMVIATMSWAGIFLSEAGILDRVVSFISGADQSSKTIMIDEYYGLQVSDPNPAPWERSVATSPLPTPTPASTWEEEYRRAKLEVSVGFAVHKGNEVRLLNPTSFELSLENIPVRDGEVEISMSAWGTNAFYFLSPTGAVHEAMYMPRDLGKFVANNQPAAYYLGLSGVELEQGEWVVHRLGIEDQIDAQFNVRDALEGVITIGYEFFNVQRTKLGFLP